MGSLEFKIGGYKLQVQSKQFKVSSFFTYDFLLTTRDLLNRLQDFLQ